MINVHLLTMLEIESMKLSLAQSKTIARLKRWKQSVVLYALDKSNRMFQ